MTARLEEAGLTVIKIETIQPALEDVYLSILESRPKGEVDDNRGLA